MIRAINRYFRLRGAAKRLDLPVRWYWFNERLLQELFNERCKRQVQFALKKRPVMLDFRSYNGARKVGHT